MKPFLYNKPAINITFKMMFNTNLCINLLYLLESATMDI